MHVHSSVGHGPIYSVAAIVCHATGKQVPHSCFHERKLKFRFFVQSGIRESMNSVQISRQGQGLQNEISPFFQDFWPQLFSLISSFDINGFVPLAKLFLPLSSLIVFQKYL